MLLDRAVCPFLFPLLDCIAVGIRQGRSLAVGTCHHVRVKGVNDDRQMPFACRPVVRSACPSDADFIPGLAVRAVVDSGLRSLCFGLRHCSGILSELFALVAQRIERSPPKRQVAGSIPAEGTTLACAPIVPALSQRYPQIAQTLEPQDLGEL